MRIIYNIDAKRLIRKNIIVESEKYRLFINNKIIKLLNLLFEFFNIINTRIAYRRR